MLKKNFALSLLTVGLLCCLNVAAFQVLDYESFAMDPAMSSAAVSPDGKSLATMQRFHKDGDNYLLIYDTADLTKKPLTIGSDVMKISRFFWANNERLVVSFRQDVEMLNRLGANTRQASRVASIDKKGKRWVELPKRKKDRRSDYSKLVENFPVPGLCRGYPRIKNTY